MRTLTIKSGGSDWEPGWKILTISRAEYGTYQGEDGDRKYLDVYFLDYPDNLNMRVYETTGRDGEEFAIGQIFRFANAGITDVLEGNDGETVIKLDDDPKHLEGKHLNVFFHKDETGEYTRVLKQVAPTEFTNAVDTFTEKDVTYWRLKAENYYKKYILKEDVTPSASTTVELKREMNGSSSVVAEDAPPF